jgi:hypothetical protein
LYLLTHNGDGRFLKGVDGVLRHILRETAAKFSPCAGVTSYKFDDGVRLRRRILHLKPGHFLRTFGGSLSGEVVLLVLSTIVASVKNVANVGGLYFLRGVI